MLLASGRDWASQALRELGAATVRSLAATALESRWAVFYNGGNLAVGRHGFNAVVHLAMELKAAVVSIDRHFPRGTWELHLERKFPLYVIYGGPEGPSRGYVRKRTDLAVAFPMPPGAGHHSFWLVASRALGNTEPVVLHLGFDIHRDDVGGYFFVDDYFYYRLGRLLSGRRFYISLECPTSPKLFKSAVASLLDGVRNVERKFEKPRGEPPEVWREVLSLVK